MAGAYVLMLDGKPLRYCGGGLYGWKPVSSTTGKPGRIVEWTLRCEAVAWMQSHAEFCRGAVVTKAD